MTLLSTWKASGDREEQGRSASTLGDYGITKDESISE
ncbi:hypothetical protein ES705_07623 [subsurface metagenome]